MVRKIFLILICLFILTSCFSQKKTIYIQKSSSMFPTVKSEQYILVDNKAYINCNPARWDMVVYQRKVSGTNYSFLARVVGLPGEYIQITNFNIEINGRLEQKPDELKKIKYEQKTDAQFGVKAEYLVPKDSVYLLCDNSKISIDSRFLGAIPLKMIIGKAKIINPE